VRIHILVELVDQTEDIAVILLQQFLQPLTRSGARRLLVGQAAADERPINLAIQVITVGHQQEGEFSRNVPANLLGKERNRIGLAAALRVPEDPQLPEVGMRGFHQFQYLLVFFIFDCPRHREHVGIYSFLFRKLDHPISEPSLRRETLFQFLLPPDRGNGVVRAEHLVIARQNFSSRAGLAGIEKDEILHEVQQPVVSEHAV
jgi:hypothetical protein